MTMTLRTIITAAFLATIAGLAPLPASAVEYNAFFFHCNNPDKHEYKEQKFLACIDESMGWCAKSCDRRLASGSSEHQKCMGYCNEYAQAHRNLQSWNQ